MFKAPSAAMGRRRRDGNHYLQKKKEFNTGFSGK
jgi:hypothetical protein